MRQLTEQEVAALEAQGCESDDWTRVEVENDFSPGPVRRVRFLGSVRLGRLQGWVSVEDGLRRKSALRDCTLHDVVLGDGCLVENVGGYISNYVIAAGAYISNVGVVSAQEGTTFGQGTEIAVLNEAGGANVVLCEGLTATTAALMLRSEEARKLARLHAQEKTSNCVQGYIGTDARVVGVREMTNVWVEDSCELMGCSRLTECTILGSDEAPTLIGPDVIMENTVVSPGATVSDGAKVYNSFVGESAYLGRGFTAESSLFFANCHMENGEACAAFCGPFSASHHKSSLLIGGQYAFYNAGSGTNFSNHAYKMGAIHFGNLLRGSKTASGAHILWPATIGAFSMVMGKVETHPDLTHLPLSYVIGQQGQTWVVPGVNLRSVGTWRDTKKWKRRDRRPLAARTEPICFDFPDPALAQAAYDGMVFLRNLLATGDDEILECEGFQMKRTSAVRGIRFYQLLLQLFVSQNHDPNEAEGSSDEQWTYLADMPVLQSDLDRLMADLQDGQFDSLPQLQQVVADMGESLPAAARLFAAHLASAMQDNPLADSASDQADEAENIWLRMVRDDAEREFQLGDIDEDFLRQFLESVK